MSPPVVDVRSPLASPSQMAQSPTSFKDADDRPFHYSRCSTDAHSSSAAGFDSGSAGFGDFSCSFALPPEPKLSGRSKVRLVKVRKKSGSDRLNRFDVAAAASVASDSDNRRNVSSCSGNGLGFVFGANSSSNSNQRKSNEEAGHSGAGEFVHSGFGFVFGNANINREHSFAWEKAQFFELEGQSEAAQLRKTSGLGFAFGESKTEFVSSLNLQQTECSENVGLSSGNQQTESGENVGLSCGNQQTVSSGNVGLSIGNQPCNTTDDSIFGDYGSDLFSNWNAKQSESNGGQGQFFAPPFGKFMDGIVFGEKTSRSASISNLEKENYRKYRSKLGHKKFVKVKKRGFNSNANKSHSVSDLNVDSGESGEREDVSSLPFSDVSNLDSVQNAAAFGASHGYTTSESNLRNNGPLDNFGSVGERQKKNGFGDRSKFSLYEDMDTDKEKGDGVFIFGGSNNRNVCFNRCSSATKGTSDLNVGIPGNCSGFVRKQSSSFSSDFRGSYNNFVFGSNNRTDGIPVSSSVNNLSDDMHTLNINDFEKINGSNKVECPTSSSRDNVSNVFIFGNNNVSSASSVGSAANFGSIYEGGNVKSSSCHEKAFTDVVNEGKAGTLESTSEKMMPDETRNTSNKAETFCENSTDSSFSVNFGQNSQPLDTNQRVSDVGNLSQDQPTNYSESEKFVSSPTFPSAGLSFRPNNSVTGTQFIGLTGDEKDSSSVSFQCRRQTSENDNMSNLNAFSSFKVNLFAMPDKKLEFTSRNRSTRERRSKNKSGKLKQQTIHQNSKADHLSKNGSPPKQDPFLCQLPKIDPTSCGTPMDCSPHPDKNCETFNHSAKTNETKYEDLTDVNETSNIGDAQRMSGGQSNTDSVYCGGSCSVSYHQEVEYVPGPGTGCMNSKAEQIDIKVPPGISSHAESGNGDCKTNGYTDSARDKFHTGNVTPTLSTPEQDGLSSIRRQYRKKYRLKVGRVSDKNVPRQESVFVTSSANEYNKRRSTDGASHEVCENWKIRGNETYKKGNLSQAEDFYTRGIDSVQNMEVSECCIEPLVLCYSNRAAARMSLGRLREALNDCAMAMSLDPNFLKAQIRAANCHLLLGEVEHAVQCFNKCLESSNTVCLDRRNIIEAADGLQKAQKVHQCKNQSAELLAQRTSDAATAALRLITNALSISCYSEKLFELKGEALCLLQKFEEAIQLCEETVGYAEKNFYFGGNDTPLDNVNNSENKNSLIWLWRWCIMSKGYYHLGKLEMSLDLIEKLEDLISAKDKHTNLIPESSISLAVTVRKLLQHKKEGNEAFQSGRHAEAVEHYSAAISSGIESLPFAAICFCNRAAGHQALGQIADAISDCSIAIALDENYSKAISRRATLHDIIRDYDQAASDLQKLISLLETQSRQKKLTGSGLKDINRARHRLSSVEEKAKKQIPLDLYVILGIKSSDASTEVRKAYRKAALRHHPDKAAQFLPRCDTGYNGQLWKEIAEKVHRDADRLFKMIGEAYAVLSDSVKRSDYDLVEETRKIHRDNYRSSNSRREDDSYTSTFERNRSSGRSSSSYSSPFEKNSGRRYEQRSWKGYSDSPQW